MSAGARPARRGTVVATPAPDAWQPEHEAAPGGAAGAATAAGGDNRMIAAMTRRGNRMALLSLRGRRRGGRRPVKPDRSRPGEIVVHQRERADALAGRREDGIDHRRRRHADGRLADAAPKAAGRHQYRLDF